MIEEFILKRSLDSSQIAMVDPHLPHVCRHSPDGFEWGYGGSGPADLAFNILYDYLLRTKCKGAKYMAIDLHQSFEWDLIAGQGTELSVTGDEIEEWLASAQSLEKLTGG